MCIVLLVRKNNQFIFLNMRPYKHNTFTGVKKVAYVVQTVCTAVHPVRQIEGLHQFMSRIQGERSSVTLINTAWRHVTVRNTTRTDLTIHPVDPVSICIMNTRRVLVVKPWRLDQYSSYNALSNYIVQFEKNRSSIIVLNVYVKSVVLCSVLLCNTQRDPAVFRLQYYRTEQLDTVQSVHCTNSLIL